jgi:hypothetical protein
MGLMPVRKGKRDAARDPQEKAQKTRWSPRILHRALPEIRQSVRACPLRKRLHDSYTIAPRTVDMPLGPFWRGTGRTLALSVAPLHSMDVRSCGAHERPPAPR